MSDAKNAMLTASFALACVCGWLMINTTCLGGKDLFVGHHFARVIRAARGNVGGRDKGDGACERVCESARVGAGREEIKRQNREEENA